MRLLAIATLFLAASPFVRAQDAASTPFRHRSPAPAEESAAAAPTPRLRPSPAPEEMETLTLEPKEVPIFEPIPTPSLEPIASPIPRPTLSIARPSPKPLASATAKPIATPPPKPTPTPKPKPTATPTPRPIASPIPKAIPTPTPISTPRPIATPTPIPAESPAADQTQGDLESKLKALEQRWEGSFMTHDVSIIEQLVASDFVGTSSSGKVGNKSTMIAEARKDKNVYTSAVSSEMSVHFFGPGVAVVTGIARETGKTPAGKVFSQAYRFTDTWMERNGQWQCVAASAMALPKK
jgi:ketosteroid isomerase-like protein